MILLKNYIKKYLIEGVATKHSADAIKVQSFLSKVGGSSNVDKTNYSLEETLEDIVTNIKDELFISFVDEYDENIPSLETNPNVTYDTPHGIYAYPLTHKTLAELRDESSIKGTTFAINRKYMHLFTKSRGVNSVDINPDGSNNYRGNLQRDKITMIKSAIMLTTSKLSGQEYKNYIQRKNKERFESLDYSNISADVRIKEIENITLDIARKNLNRVKNSLKNNPSTQEYDVIHHIVLVTNILSCISLIEKSVTKSKDLDLATEIVYDILENVTFSDENTHYRKYGNKMSDFHVLMSYAYFLSMPVRDSKMSLTPDGGDDPSLGTYFTVLLDEIGINMVNDKGTGTIHRNEPLQAFYLNTSKRLRIKHVGTYKNIFHHKHAPIDFDKAFLNLDEKYPHLNLLSTDLFDDSKAIEKIKDEALDYFMSSPFRSKLGLVMANKNNKIINCYVNVDIYKKKITFDISIKQDFLQKSKEEKLVALRDAGSLYNDANRNIAHMKNILINMFYMYIPKDFLIIESEANFEQLQRFTYDLRQSFSSKENDNPLISKGYDFIDFFLMLLERIDDYNNKDISY